ncbi:MAG TPA: orotate phosphoribosyltransferase [Stellaceae bacterium]
MGQVMKSPIDHPPSNYERLRQIIAERCFTKGQPFQLSSGRMSNFYFNLKPAMLDPEGLDLLADIILERIAGIDARYIGGLAMGAVPLAIAVLLKSNATARPLQGFWVRKEAKGHGTKNLTDGYIQDGARVIIVEDVTTSGDSVMQAINEVKRRGCDIAAVITIVDRLEGAEERLAQNGVKLTALFTAKDFT